MDDPGSQRKKEREREKIRERKAKRVTYDLPPVQRQHIQALAAEHGLPASQLVILALLRFLKAYQEGEIQLERYKQPSRSPRYDWNLVFPPDLLATIKHKGKE